MSALSSLNVELTCVANSVSDSVSSFCELSNLCMAKNRLFVTWD